MVEGCDGKTYPQMPRPHAELNAARWASHRMVHGRKLSIRQAQRAMLAEQGIRRSVGAIFADLRDYECPACASPPVKAKVIHWQ